MIFPLAHYTTPAGVAPETECLAGLSLLMIAPIGANFILENCRLNSIFQPERYCTMGW